MSGDLTLGRGELYFAQFGQNQTPGGERPLGNCPEFMVNVEQETLDHYNSQRGLREKDESIVIEATRTASIVTDNISVENLALFFFGSADTLTQSSSAGQSEVFSGVVPGLTYQLGMTASNPTGIRSVANVTVTDGAATTYVLDTDYTLDAERARVTPISGGAITSGSAITVNFDIQAVNRDVVIAADTEIEGALRFLSFAPKGRRIDYYMPYVKIRPNGDLSLIQESEWMSAPFNLEILKKGDLASIYLDGQPYSS